MVGISDTELEGVFSVHWSPAEKSTFVSCSWDTTIKIVSTNPPALRCQTIGN